MSRYKKKKKLKLSKSHSYKAELIFFSLCVFFFSKTKIICWETSLPGCLEKLLTISTGKKVAKDFTQDKNDLAAPYILFI